MQKFKDRLFTSNGSRKKIKSILENSLQSYIQLFEGLRKRLIPLIVLALAVFSINVFAGQGLVLNGSSQYAQVTLPNDSALNNLNGFQVVWRMRGADLAAASGITFQITGMGTVYQLPVTVTNPPRLDADISRSLNGIYMTPTEFSDIICKLQLNPATSSGTFETWKADGTGREERTFTLNNSNNYNLAGETLTIGANSYGVNFGKLKVDYFRVIQRVEALGVLPTAAAPTGVTYLVDYEFDGNANDSSSRGANLTLTGSPSFDTTP